MQFFANDFFSLIESGDHIYIKVEQKGFDIKEFNLVLQSFPRVSITKFSELKTALEEASSESTLIGSIKPAFEITLSNDDLEAYIVCNLSKEEYLANKRRTLTEILSELQKMGVTYGVKAEIIQNGIDFNKKILIAQGKLPVHGKDAAVTYIELPKYEPKISQDGKTDYYSVDIVKEVKKGDWLGEKKLATEGVPGFNLKGDILNPRNGKDVLLRYDPKSVEVVEKGKSEILLAKHDGIVAFKNGKITVADHLIIDGDVNYSTGNIEFSGSVTIKGTVQDGFKVVAGGDISVLGDIGVGRVELIESIRGKVYIKGGISGKNTGVIVAKSDIFVKFAKDCYLISQADVHIGYYAIDSDIQANNIFIKSDKGQIIGGKLHAKAKIISQVIGNKAEKQTILNVDGFDRKKLKIELDELLLAYKENLIEIEKNCKTMAIFENHLKDNQAILKTNEYQYYKLSNEELLKKISKLDQRRTEIMKMLESKGDGEISVNDKAYPKTCIEIKKIKTVVKELTSGSFYIQNNRLHQN